MNIEEFINLVTSTYLSLGSATVIVVALSAWLGKLWAKRILQNELNEHSEKLANLQKSLDFINQKDVTRHNNKLATYREGISLISEALREVEAIYLGKRDAMDPETEHEISLRRNEIYGNIALVSNQEVMDRYNDLIDYLISYLYQDKEFVWSDMRTKADAMLNAMRRDLDVNDGEVVYRGEL